MVNFLHQAYRRFMTLDSAQTLAMKSAYAGQWHRWCESHKSGNQFQHPRDLHAHILGLEALRGPISYLEFGVHQGESLEWWVQGNQHPDSRFVGFDSFEGLPVDWRPDFPKGHFATGKPPDIADPRCSFQVGWFNQTLAGFVAGHDFRHPTVINLDADLYGSTLCVLFGLVAKLKRGDILLLDDFSDSLHVFRAFLDFLSAYPIEYELIAQHPRYVRIALRIVGLPSPG